MFKRKFLRFNVLMVSVLAAAALLSSCVQSAATAGPPTTTAPTPTTTPVATTVPTSTTKTPTYTPTSANGDLTFLIDSDPAVIDNSKLPVTPIDKIHVTGTPANYDMSTYHLKIWGNVNTELNLTLDDIKALPSVTQTVLLICPGIFADNAEWTGVPITALLEAAGIGDKAYEASFFDDGQYQKSFFLTDVQRDGVFLAYMVDGQPLPEEHGFPLRLVVQGEYGNTWVKWVNEIEIK